MVRTHLYISGRVQGVFYRVYTQEQAQKLGLKGWVQNLPDGRVEAVFEGEKEDVDEMIEWCKKGSPGAKVERVEIGGSEFGEFKIRR